MNRSLVIGDPHFKANNKKDTKLFVSQTLTIAKQSNVSLIIVLGDILHDHETSKIRTYRRATKFLHELTQIAHTVLLIGNHDRPNNSDFLSEKHFFTPLKKWNNLTIVDKVTVIGNMFFVPYVPPGRFLEALQTCPEFVQDPLSFKVGFAHQEFSGCDMGGIISTKGDKWPLHYPQIYSGHIHKMGRPQQNIFYPGTPYQTARDETGEKGLLLLNFDQGITEQFIPLDMPKKITLQLSCQDLEAFTYEGNDYLYLEVHGSVDEILLVKKSRKVIELKKQGIQFIFRPEKAARVRKEYKKLSYAQALHSFVDEVPEVLSLFEKLFGKAS